MHRLFAPALLATAFLAGCDGTQPLKLEPVIADIEITPRDSVLLGDTMTMDATVTTADDVVLADAVVAWSSSDPEILRVDGASGRLIAVRPGTAFIRAQSRAASDSTAVAVSTACGSFKTLQDVGSNFRWTAVNAGSIDPNLGIGLRTEYMQTQAMFSAGVMYGMDASSLVVGRSSGGAIRNITGPVCDVMDDAPYHSIAVLNGVPAIPGLTVIQDVYAFATANTDDFILYRYEFTNEGSAPVENLAVAMNVDFDLYATSNVGSFDRIRGVADAAAPDSAENSIVVGYLAVDEELAGYRAYGVSDLTETKEILYGFMTGGVPGPDRIGPADIRQIMSVQPFDLAPGQTREIWFAIVGGENRTAFTQHVEQAAAMARFLRDQG